MNNIRSKIIIKIYRWGNFIHYKMKSKTLKTITKPICKVIYKVVVELLFGTELAAETKIGKNLMLPHGGNGLIIHSHASIGDNVVIYHQVTIGGFGLAHFDEEYRIANQAKSAGAPVIGNNVIIGTGAKILGNVNIGDGARIGANAVVLKDVPPNATAVGVPAKIIEPN